jgi:hypothetical protein
VTLSEALKQFDLVLKEMDKRIKPDKTKGFQRLVWPFNKNENADFIARIERYKLTFGLALGIHNVYVFAVRNLHAYRRQSLQDIQMKMEEILCDTKSMVILSNY